MIVATHGEDLEVRGADFSGTSIIPPPGVGSGALSWAGRLVSDRDAFGLVAVASCIRLVSGQMAGMPFGVYGGSGAERQPARSAWQWDLLHEMPSPDWDSFRFMEAVASSIEATGNGFVEKVRPRVVRGGGPRVVELRPMDPDYVQVRFKDGVKRIYWWDGGKTVEVTERVLHIPGWAGKPSATGWSVIRLHKDSIGKNLALDTYQGRYFQNDARPGVIVDMKGNPTAAQRQEVRDGFRSQHAGAGNAHDVAVTWGGMTVTPIQSALRDTQAVELQNAAIDEAARMFQLPAKMIGGGLQQRQAPESPEAEFTRFFRVSLFPRVRRIERAFATDPDLFPPGGDLSPRFDPSELLRADTATTANVIHALKQVGVVTANEGRSWLSLPRVPGGDVLQETPVGGAPNTGTPAVDPALEPAAA